MMTIGWRARGRRKWRHTHTHDILLALYWSFERPFRKSRSLFLPSSLAFLFVWKWKISCLIFNESDSKQVRRETTESYHHSKATMMATRVSSLSTLLVHSIIICKELDRLPTPSQFSLFFFTKMLHIFQQTFPVFP